MGKSQGVTKYCHKNIAEKSKKSTPEEEKNSDDLGSDRGDNRKAQ